VNGQGNNVVTRWLFRSIGLTVGLSLLLASLLLYQNNRSVPLPDRTDLTNAYNKSVAWVIENQVELLQVDNSVLWKFLYESARITKDPELTKLAQTYIKERLHPRSPWRYYFDPYAAITIDPATMEHFPDYNLFILYGLSCSPALEALPLIQRQFSDDFCLWSPIVSPCTTHQLIGVKFIQERQCDTLVAANELEVALLEDIERQLTIDPRMGDVYIQRAMMLMITGAYDTIKPVWIQRILDQQLADGSWTNFDPLFPVGGDRFFGFSYFFLDIREPKANFHTTAQAIYLMALSVASYSDMRQN
jgi:hypothetical protein